jgi:hypothetical protein
MVNGRENVILSPSLLVILNEVKNLKALRINSAKDLFFLNFHEEARFFALPLWRRTQNDRVNSLAPVIERG